MRRHFYLWTIAFVILPTPTPAPDADRIRFKISLSQTLGLKGAAGRMLVFMSNSAQKPAMLAAGFIPGSVWIASAEVGWVAAGQSITLDPDAKAFPKPFSLAPRGTYHFMALLDRNHSYGYNGTGEGDLYSTVISVKDADPANAETVDLALDHVMKPGFTAKDTPDARLVEFRSPLLSAFWGRPISMRAGVVLPPEGTPPAGLPAVYHVHGFGGNHHEAWFRGKTLRSQMASGKLPKMTHVFLDASFSTGHHVFADSVNNGPWGKALSTEFIPHIERLFRLTPKPYARFLTGHSSGGWSTLWLQVAYPGFFGGTWSTSPDPVDLREFTGIDATPGSTDNAYRTRGGKPKNLVRMGGQNLVSIEEFVRQEEVVGDFGGQFASFEWVWSPKGAGGRPVPLFNRVTGEQDPEVQKAWRKYDIRRVLETNWATIGPKLRGKLNVICGEEDTFHLEAGVKRLREFFSRVHSDAVCELIPGRDHMNLYQPYKSYAEGLEVRIAKEMKASFDRHRPAGH